MKVGNTGSVGKGGPIRRKPLPQTSGVEAAPAVRNIADTSSVLGIPPEEMTERVHRAIMTLMSEVESMRRELELAHRKISELERLADQDSLINISNRRAFVREMTRMISYSERYGINSSLIYLDLNDLKVINDTYGHAAGDAALVYLAETMLKSLRDSDIIGRLGGDEFGIILPKATEADAVNKATYIVEQIRQSPLQWNGQKIELHVAYGVYSLKSGETPDQALDQADKKMYAHKQGLKKEKA